MKEKQMVGRDDWVSLAQAMRSLPH